MNGKKILLGIQSISNAKTLVDDVLTLYSLQRVRIIAKSAGTSWHVRHKYLILSSVATVLHRASNMAHAIGYIHDDFLCPTNPLLRDDWQAIFVASLSPMFV